MTTRHALVTGAGTGIGRAFARRLAAEGWTVTAVGRDQERLRALTDELGPRHRHLAADLTTPDGLARITEDLARHHVNLLINNAGVAHHGLFHRTPAPEAVAALRLNCEAVVTLAHTFLTQARDGDALINISSTLGYAPTPGLAVYSAGKAFVTTFSEALWHEQRPRGVHVMALCPGPTATESAARHNQDVPAALIRTPEAVVTTALRALDRRTRHTVVPGPANSLFALAARLLPRRLILAALSR
ncbi:SDR family NAD(P)-dependent oxidoreductase [Kitasatospora sp. NPDC050463]|uniref:SDR family NAD(P)-dependent oxidoreductase n=1 Tax=Kitasatospora sp. NPDC050463 TaxID=3155786 RepID=UPI0033DBD3E8